MSDEKDSGILLRLELRDWFAGQAMHAMFAICSDPRGTSIKMDPNAVARFCYATADEMLAERTKEPTL